MMGIWLPYPNVKANLDVLTDSHLADVVWQGLDVLRALPNTEQTGIDRYRRMWQARPATLLNYVVQAEAELRRRGIGEEPRVFKAFTWYGRLGISLAPVPLWWYGHPKFHVAQRSHLIAVDPEHYARRLPLDTPLDLMMIWPLETANEWEQKSNAGKDRDPVERGQRSARESDRARRGDRGRRRN